MLFASFSCFSLSLSFSVLVWLLFNDNGLLHYLYSHFVLITTIFIFDFFVFRSMSADEWHASNGHMRAWQCIENASKENNNDFSGLQVKWVTNAMDERKRHSKRGNGKQFNVFLFLCYALAKVLLLDGCQTHGC